MSKIKLHPAIAKIKGSLEKGNHLVDYFLVCGIPPSSCVNDILYETKNPKYEEIFKENFKPSIISRFPEFDNSADGLDTKDNLFMDFIFPEEFKPIITNNLYMESKTKFYTTILDNSIFSVENPHKFLSCLLFYENIDLYRDLKKKIEEENDILDIEEVEETPLEQNNKNNEEKKDEQEKQNENNNENNDNNNNENNNDNNNNNENNNDNENNNNNKKELEEEIQNNKIKLKSSTNIKSSLLINNDNNNNKKVNSSPLEKTDENNPFQKFAKINTTIGSKSSLLRRSSRISQKESFVYIPKVICLISTHPYLKTFEKILKSIYDYYTDLNNKYDKEIPIEKYITNLILEVPIPPRGLYSISYEFLNNEYFFKGYENNKLFITENNLYKFNSLISLKVKLEIFKHLLFGSQVIFFSTELNLISETIINFLTLLHPFKYHLQATSNVFKDEEFGYSVLESVTGYFLGINKPFEENFMEKNEVNIENLNLLLVDLDNYNNFKLLVSEDFPNLPSRLTGNLEKEIKNLENKNKEKKENEINLEKFNEAYQNIFFEFFCEMIKGYEDYLNMDFFKVDNKEKADNIEFLFQGKKFIKLHSSSEQEFYTKLVEECQMFSDFIMKIMIPKNNQDIIDVLLVNETNIKIKNRNKYFGKEEPTDFLDSKEYTPSNKYLTPERRPLVKVEIDTIIKKKKELLTYGQEYIPKYNNDDTEETKMVFNYILFPQLDFSIYFNPDNVESYINVPDYTEEIEAINSELLSKSSIGKNINLGLEMQNNIYLTWLEVWSYSFWYMDKDERQDRFDQALDIIDRVIHHDINIFTLMFEALDQKKEVDMLIKLYKKMLLLKLNPNSKIHNIISNILDNNEIKGFLDKMKNNDKNKESLKFKDIPNFKFKPRTFLFYKDKPSLLNEKIKFERKYSCIECENNTYIDLYKLCSNFEGVKNDVLWAPCYKGHYNLPKLKITFGTEIFPFNTIKHQNNSTSTINDIVLHSPYNLKINIKNAIKNKYGSKLELDKFKTDFSALFWNFIWYCYVQRLDYGIILPYPENIEKIRMDKLIRNLNSNSIRIIYDNDTYNVNKIKLKEIEDGKFKERKKRGSIIINNKFQGLTEERVESLTIYKEWKIKKKKNVGKFINEFFRQTTFYK